MHRVKRRFSYFPHLRGKIGRTSIMIGKLIYKTAIVIGRSAVLTHDPLHTQKLKLALFLRYTALENVGPLSKRRKNNL